MAKHDFPIISEETRKRLALFNANWEERRQNWLKYCPPPWWEDGLIISPELRGIYEAWLPFEEFRRGLLGIAGAFLPDEDWIPFALGKKGVFLSLADFWAALPVELASKVTFSEEEILPLFCALADPPRFGTNSGRYPGQLPLLAKALSGKQGARILDVGCGVGLNTLEIAEFASGLVPQLTVVGMTSEPLEVWMANARFLPHDPLRQKAFEQYKKPVEFVRGFAESFNLKGSFDVIVCNGLVGGRFLNTESQYHAFLESFQKAMPSGGTMLLANRFHEGTRYGLYQFRRMAQHAGFEVSGEWRSFTLVKK